MEVIRTERPSLYLAGDQHKFDLSKDSDFMEVTKWVNGDGFTISICNELGPRTFELSWEELEGIKYLINKLEYED